MDVVILVKSMLAFAFFVVNISIRQVGLLNDNGYKICGHGKICSQFRLLIRISFIGSSSRRRGDGVKGVEGR